MPLLASDLNSWLELAQSLSGTLSATYEAQRCIAGVKENMVKRLEQLENSGAVVLKLSRDLSCRPSSQSNTHTGDKSACYHKGFTQAHSVQ